MMTLAVAMGAVGMVAGVAVVLLGVAQLACEHAESPLCPRITTGLLAVIGGWVALDSWDDWSGIDHHIDAKAIAFSVALALSWGYRRAVGYRSERRSLSLPHVVRD